MMKENVKCDRERNMATKKDMESEIENLGKTYGQPEMINALLPTGQFDPMKSKRESEVVSVIIRPNGKLILITKPFYPADTYRLPSGGIETGEGIEEALHREIYEETGLKVQIIKFVAMVRYKTRISPNRFTSYVFLVREISGKLACLDEDEDISGYKEIDVAELPDIIAHLENLDGGYSEWGAFRAIPHKAVLNTSKIGGQSK